MDELVPVKVLQQYLITFELPDPKFAQQAEATRILKALGCTLFHQHRYYDIAYDGLKMTVIGYIVDPAIPDTSSGSTIYGLV